MCRWIVATAIVAVALAGRPALCEQTLEVGGEYGTYTGDLGHTVSEFASFTWAQGSQWTLRGDASHESRLDDSGFGFGFSAQRSLGKARLGAGLSSGTGDVIHSRYRFDIGGQFDLPIQGLQANAGYTRLQSKGDNSSDGFSGGLLYWYGGHWIFGASGRHEIGHPGETSSNSADLSVTWFQWLRVYCGVGYRFGAVSYQLLGPTTALVDYDETDLYGTVSWYLRPGLGLNGRLDLLENDVYDLTVVRLSLFKQW